MYVVEIKMCQNHLKNLVDCYKNYRLCGLAILAIEQEILDKSDFNNIIKDFSATKPKKIPLSFLEGI